MPNGDPVPDLSYLKNHCRFCAAELERGAVVCPECGRTVGGEMVVAPPKPAWVKVLAAVVLAMFVLLGVAVLVSALR